MRRTDAPAEAFDAIAQGLDRLCQELAVVREVLDEIRDELQWANRNRHPEDWSAAWQNDEPKPADTVAPDELENRRRRSAATLPADANTDEAGPTRPPGQLF